MKQRSFQLRNQERLLSYTKRWKGSSELDSRKAQVVELKYFGGLKEDEIAEVLKVSSETVRREWRFAKAWLHNELHEAA